MPTILDATVKYAAGPPREGKYGQRINVVCTAPDGQDIRLWGNPDDPISQLKKGQQIKILHDKKGAKEEYKWLQTADSLPLESPQKTLPPAGYEPLSNEQKNAIAGYVREQASLLGYCLEAVAHESRLSQLSEEGQRAAATTLYIQVQKKFGG